VSWIRDNSLSGHDGGTRGGGLSRVSLSCIFLFHRQSKIVVESLIEFSPLFFDLAPKRETGGPKGRLFHSALFDTTVFSIVFLFFSIPPDTGYTIPKKLNQLYLKEEDEKREERID